MSQPAFSALAPLPFEIIYEDGEPLESDWHVRQGAVLAEAIRRLMTARQRTDYYVGVNLGVYYSLEQARQVSEEVAKGLPAKAFRAPDLFWVGGVDNHSRDAWLAWEEGGRLPDLIVELLSRKTARQDRTVKKDLYRRVFGTGEYFLIDPATNRLEGFDLVDGVYRSKAPTIQGRLWCHQLDVYLGFWRGTWQGMESDLVRLFDREGNLWPTAEEEAESARQEIARLRARLGEAGQE